MGAFIQSISHATQGIVLISLKTLVIAQADTMRSGAYGGCSCRASGRSARSDGGLLLRFCSSQPSLAEAHGEGYGVQFAVYDAGRRADTAALDDMGSGRCPRSVSTAAAGPTTRSATWRAAPAFLPANVFAIGYADFAVHARRAGRRLPAAQRRSVRGRARPGGDVVLTFAQRESLRALYALKEGRGRATKARARVASASRRRPVETNLRLWTE